MSKCIIHVGMNKTGSTSIQYSLDRFDDDNFLYASLGNSPNHSFPTISLFSNNPLRHQLRRGRKRDTSAIKSYNDRIRKRFDEAVSASSGRTLLLSGEGISNRLGQDELIRLRDYLTPEFDEIEIFLKQETSDFDNPEQLTDDEKDAIDEAAEAARQLTLNVTSPKL